MKKFRLSCVLLLSCIAGCSKIDNIILGRDNTPPPSELAAFKPTLEVDQPWQNESSSGTGNTYLKILPAVDEEKVYAADYKGHVFAFERKTGKKVWKNSLNVRLTSGPVVMGDYLAVTDNQARVIVLDVNTGKRLWKHAVSNEIFAPPTIAEGKVFVKTVDGKLYAFDEQDGKQLWVYDHGASGMAMRSGSSPQVLFGTVVAGFSDGKLDGLRADTGQLLWEKTIAIPEGVSDVERMVDIDANPVIDEGVAYVAAYQDSISAMSLRDGQFLWQKKISTLNNMALSGNALYVTDTDGVVWALDKSTGTVLWKQTALKGHRITAPAVMPGEALITADFQGMVHWISLDDGRFINRTRPSKSAIYAEPVVDGQNVYVLSSSGKLVAYWIP